MICTPKQIEVLRWLYRYKYVCIAQFHAHLFAGTTWRNAELAVQKLDKKGLVKRLRLPSMNGESFGMVCHLTRKGTRYLESEGLIDASRRYEPIKRPICSINHYGHRKKLVDFLIHLDMSIARLPNLRVKQLLTEFRQRPVALGGLIETTLMSGSDKIVPDIIFVLQNVLTGKEVIFCVEIDTATETIGGLSEITPTESILGKFQSYERILLSGSWRAVVNSSALAYQVLLVSEADSRLKTVFSRMVDKIDRGEFFLGTTHDKIVQQDMLTSPIWLKSLEVRLQSLLS